MSQLRFVEYEPPMPGVYPLPDASIPARVLEQAGPWLQSLTGDIVALKESLRTRWAKIRSRSVRQFRDQLLSYEPHSIVAGDRAAWLRLKNPAVAEADEGVGDSAYLLEPIEIEQKERAQLKKHGIKAGSSCEEFLHHFGGLSEAIDSAGHFVRFGYPWETMIDSWDNSINGFDEWEGALMIYHARIGDRVLLRSDGRVAWWVLAEHLIRDQSESFDDFLQYYVEYRNIPWPLDSYGP